MLLRCTTHRSVRAAAAEALEGRGALCPEDHRVWKTSCLLEGQYPFAELSLAAEQLPAWKELREGRSAMAPQMEREGGEVPCCSDVRGVVLGEWSGVGVEERERQAGSGGGGYMVLAGAWADRIDDLSFVRVLLEAPGDPAPLLPLLLGLDAGSLWTAKVEYFAAHHSWPELKDLLKARGPPLPPLCAMATVMPSAPLILSKFCPVFLAQSAPENLQTIGELHIACPDLNVEVAATGVPLLEGGERVFWRCTRLMKELAEGCLLGEGLWIPPASSMSTSALEASLSRANLLLPEASSAGEGEGGHPQAVAWLQGNTGAQGALTRRWMRLHLPTLFKVTPPSLGRASNGLADNGAEPALPE